MTTHSTQSAHHTRLIHDESSEEWRPIPGWEGLYEASSLGRVRSLDRIDAKGARRKGRVLRPGRAGYGYEFYCLSLNGAYSYHLGHALIALAFLGPRPDGMQIAHGDGSKTNNAVQNLRYATPTENQLDKRAHGTDHNVNKTHCPHGHPYSGDNLAFTASGGRRCRACERAREARRRQKTRELREMESAS